MIYLDKKLVQNYIYSILYQLLIVFTPFITTPYLARVMGEETLNINVLTANLVQWFVIFGIMGVNHYGNREIARVRDNDEDRSKTFIEIFIMQLVSMIFSTALYFMFAFRVYPDLSIYVLAQSITLLSVSLDITWFFYGVEDFKKASIRNMIVKVVGIALIFTMVDSPDDIMTFILINACTAVCGQFIMWAQLPKYVKFTKVTVQGVLRHVRPNIALFIPQIATSVYTVLDVTMIGVLSQNEVDATFYDQAQKFVKMFLFFITSIGSVMLPRISNTFSKGNHDEIKYYLRNTLRFAMYLSIPMIFGIVGMIQNFIDWFLPSSFSVVGLMIICTSPIILFISLSNVFGTQFMIPTGLTKEYTISVVSGSIINFIINLILIPRYSAYGAIIASVCAEFSVTIIQWVLVRKKIPARVGFNDVYRYIVSGTVMALIVYQIGELLGSSILVNFIQVSIGGVLYFLICFLLQDPFQKSVFSKVLKRGRNHG